MPPRAKECRLHLYLFTDFAFAEVPLIGVTFLSFGLPAFRIGEHIGRTREHDSALGALAMQGNADSTDATAACDKAEWPPLLFFVFVAGQLAIAVTCVVAAFYLQVAYRTLKEEQLLHALADYSRFGSVLALAWFFAIGSKSRCESWFLKSSKNTYSATEQAATMPPATEPTKAPSAEKMSEILIALIFSSTLFIVYWLPLLVVVPKVAALPYILTAVCQPQANDTSDAFRAVGSIESIVSRASDVATAFSVFGVILLLARSRWAVLRFLGITVTACGGLVMACVLTTSLVAGVVAQRIASESQGGPWASKAGEEALALPDLTNSIGMKMKLLPPGTFQMGLSVGDDGPGEPRRVTLTRPFYLGVHEVTNAQYRRVMGTAPSKWQDDDNPVESVARHEADEFCRRLSVLPEEIAAGRAYRLPTEAEWEYACRANTTTRYSFGDDAARLGQHCWFYDNSVVWSSTPGKTHPVGHRRPNPWGLHDMHGNVLELCSDVYAKYPVGDAVDPRQSDGGARIVRGGSCLSTASECASDVRYIDWPRDENNLDENIDVRVPINEWSPRWCPAWVHDARRRGIRLQLSSRDDPRDRLAYVGFRVAMTAAKAPAAQGGE